LIIDDNRQTAEALKASLLLWNISAKIALMPSTAMAFLKENIPDVIFLDLNMPELNGFEMLAYVKSKQNLKNVPVIFVTSDDQPEIAKRAIQGGAYAIIIKPVMPDLLEASLIKANLI